MPIVVKAVSQQDYVTWLVTAKDEFAMGDNVQPTGLQDIQLASAQ
jgi:hypothetical protein